MIDFGEMKGADASYDLGHLGLHNPYLLETVLEGYERVVPLPRQAFRRISFFSLLIGVRRLAEMGTSDADAVRRHPFVELLRQHTSLLLR